METTYLGPVDTPLHAALERRAEAARHLHAFNRRATLPDRRAEPARLSGGRAKPARPLDRRAGFARLSAHISLSIREAYNVSRAIGATVYVAPIARLTNPPPSLTTQIRKQMTGHARQTLTRPNHQGLIRPHIKPKRGLPSPFWAN
ncbi:hypothetical protein PCASD_23959 [Puccinia coronata f. sp. avenae]|uniref:Uncharacterized protein n=1 Tax=Puccinia coronata f. sp. avenae TaxID=200324 RepID=A0A2N5TP36_9BASI|nr:hypothetical protein PCASD_23959 [Puccinia coronata f. sp. avenae]